MGKFLILTLGSLALHTAAFGFEKLPSTYQIAFGNPKASIHVVEYFSLSCHKCIESFKKDFKVLREKYVDSEDVLWTFHPHPGDLPTLKAMICLEKLSPKEKKIFLEVLMENFEQDSEDNLLMPLVMETLGKPVPELDQLDSLKNSAAFKFAHDFLRQKDAVQEFPTVEINGKIFDDFPTRKFMEKTLNALVTVKRIPHDL